MLYYKKGDNINTFLPYPDFSKSAKCLDYKRLGKQRVETWQIYQTLKKGQYQPCKCGCNEVFNGYCIGCYSKVKKTAWYNHPICKMWKGYERSLLFYGLCICEEWIRRGYKDSLKEKFYKELIETGSIDITQSPKWLGNQKFHASMRSNLLRKEEKYYNKFGWKEENNLPYYWIV